MKEPRNNHLIWNGVEWIDDRCGCRYHPDDDNGSHGGAPHVHLCEHHGGAAELDAHVDADLQRIIAVLRERGFLVASRGMLNKQQTRPWELRNMAAREEIAALQDRLQIVLLELGQWRNAFDTRLRRDGCSIQDEVTPRDLAAFLGVRLEDAK